MKSVGVAALLTVLVLQQQHHLTPPVAGIMSNSFTDHFELLYKGTYIAYGNGRASERDLPECGTYDTISTRGGVEACNLSHRRYWRPPLVERLCRCPGHTSCPLHHYNTNNTAQVSENGNGLEGHEEQLMVQHINNRAHLQFCIAGIERSNVPVCDESGENIGLTVELVERYELQQPTLTTGWNSSSGGGGINSDMVIVVDSHTMLHCQCQEPRYWTHINSTTTIAAAVSGVGTRRGSHRQQTTRLLHVQTHTYACQQLPRCSRDEPCSEVRRDMYESYYTCSCPPQHLCLLPRPPAVMRAAKKVPHYAGNLMQGVCTPHYRTRTTRNSRG